VADTSLNRPALTVLGASAFVYVTAETIPVGLLPQIATGLNVSEARVGLLLTSYAVVAGLTTIPLTALTMRIPRHRLIAVTVAVFAVSQVAAALAPTFLILMLTRLICALAHGVFWSAIGPVTARLAPPGRAGKATALVFLGNSLAIVLGVPLGTALGQWLGWRVAIAILAALGALCVVALLIVLPALPALPRDLATRTRAQLRASITIIRDRPVALLCLVTAVLVIGHFSAYTYIAPLVRRDGGLQGTGLSLLLLGYGAVGLLGNFVVGRLVDRRPGPVVTILLATMVVSVAALAPILGPIPTIIAALIWGGAFTAIPVCLASGVLRVAPRSRDAASALYVVAFQIGIGGGAFIGERLVSTGHLGRLPLLAAVLALLACALVLGPARAAFPTHIPDTDYESAEADLSAPLPH
jgi:predicted MFS family arabinose efflux permease